MKTPRIPAVSLCFDFTPGESWWLPGVSKYYGENANIYTVGWLWFGLSLWVMK